MSPRKSLLALALAVAAGAPVLYASTAARVGLGAPDLAPLDPERQDAVSPTQLLERRPEPAAADPAPHAPTPRRGHPALADDVPGSDRWLPHRPFVVVEGLLPGKSPPSAEHAYSFIELAGGWTDVAMRSHVGGTAATTADSGLPHADRAARVAMADGVDADAALLTAAAAGLVPPAEHSDADTASVTNPSTVALTLLGVAALLGLRRARRD